MRSSKRPRPRYDRGSRVAPPLVAFLVGLLAFAAAAQPPKGAAPDRPALSEVVDVHLVNVEVWVADRRGEPVEGLTAADFEVLEDDKRVEITHFSEVRGDRPLAAARSGRDAPNPNPGSTPSEAAPQGAAARPSAAPSHLVIYLDELHLSPATRKRPIEDLRAFVRSGDVDPAHVLILAQGRDLVTAAPFGSTAKQLDAALERLQSSPGLGTAIGGEKRIALQRLQQMWTEAQQNARGGPPCENFVRQAVAEVQYQSQENARRITLTLDHLAGSVRFLAALEGVKTLLYLSDSLATRPGEDLLRFVEGVCPLPDRSERFGLMTEDLGTQLHELTRHANANRVTIHSLQTLGLQPNFIGMAEQENFDVRAGNPFEMARNTTERAGLSMLADETGGRAVFNKSRFDGELETIAREMSSYYTLAYVPSHGGDGLSHRIDVRVPGPYDVRHRRGYRDKDGDERLEERLEGALYLGLVDNPLAVRLASGEVGGAEKGSYDVTLHVLVPSTSVAFLPQAEGARARLTLLLAVRHENSAKLDTIRRTVDIPASTPQTDTIALSASVDLQPGVNLVGVAVRDDVTGEASLVSTTLELPAAKKSGRDSGSG